jgi:hypothetical protein
MGDDIKQRRQEIKGRLLGAFNKVAPKVMKVDDLVRNFERDDGRYFKWYETPQELILEHMIHNMMGKRDVPAERGVYTSVENGKTVNYVSSEFLRRHLISAIDSGRADEFLGDIEKAGFAAVDAVRDSPDQTPRVRSGELKPKTPAPKK